MNVLKHKINLIYLFSITVKPKTFNPDMQKKMKQKIQDFLRWGIIRSSNSPYLTSILIVKKKDKTIQICSTPINLNVIIIDDSQLLPNMREPLDIIIEAKYYSS